MDANLKGMRVLMIGPGKDVISGIVALVEAFWPVLEKQVTLFYFPTVKRRLYKDAAKLSFGNLIIIFSQYIRFLVALFRFRPHVVHLHTSQGIAWLKDTYYVIIGKLFHARVILHIHGGNFDTLYEKYPRIFQWYTQRVLGLADALIVVSIEWKMRLAKFVPATRVFPIKNCIDIQAFRANSNFSAGQAVNVLFIGRIGAFKGVFDLIEAVHILEPGRSDFHLWLVGPEERKGEVQQVRHLLDSYHLTDTCELVGPVQRERILQLLSEASVFVLPSQYEGLPIVILEALAAGLPIIATCVGGIPEVVQDNVNGFLVPPGDVKGLANALARLVNDADLRQKMGERSREIAEREFNVQSYTEKIVSLYSSLVR